MKNFFDFLFALLKGSSGPAPLKTVPSQESPLGRDVLSLQKALLKKGFNPGPLDGIMGSQTTKAISNFQKSIGLAGSGEVGPKTLAALGLEVLPAIPTTGKSAITSDLVAKKDRKLHPNKRAQIEALVFPEGKIPQHWKDMDIERMNLDVYTAIGKLGFKESGGNNYGRDIGEIQDIIGSNPANGNGDAWCLSLAQMAIAFVEDFVGVESPVPATEHCVTCWNGAKQVPALTTTNFRIGTLCLGQRMPSSNGHAMLVLSEKSSTQMNTVEGNTSIASMTDGDGSVFKVRNKKMNGDLVTLGFVFTYPLNQPPRNFKVW